MISIAAPVLAIDTAHGNKDAGRDEQPLWSAVLAGLHTGNPENRVLAEDALSGVAAVISASPSLTNPSAGRELCICIC